jgi:type II secretory pathway component PulJ
MNLSETSQQKTPKRWAGRFASRAGITLVEMLIATTIGVTMIGMAVLSSVDLYKNLAAAETYSLMHNEARQAIATISRDIRCAISNSTLSSSHLTLVTIDRLGATNTVNYVLQTNPLDPTTKNLIRTVSGTTNTLTSHATSVLFEYWNSPGNRATNAYDSVEVRVSLVITNTGSFRLTTDLLQTRAKMRNKHF